MQPSAAVTGSKNSADVCCIWTLVIQRLEPIRRSEDAQIFRSSDLKCWQPSISICQRHRQRQMHMQMRIQMQEQQHRCICLPKRIRRASNPLNVRKQHSSVGCHNGCDDPRTGGVNIQELIQIFGVVSHRRFP